jgi:branched-chain amino acid transport system permease protein
MAAGDAPGLDLVIYGGVLIAVVAFAPRGITGLIEIIRNKFSTPAGQSLGRRHG